MATLKPKIADLHCDLLSFLVQYNAHAEDPKSRCSALQLKEGNVGLQTLAIFVQTKISSTLLFQKQLDAFLNLPTLYPSHFARLQKLEMPGAESVGIIVAIENASGFATEEEPLDLAFCRMDEFLSLTQPLYISLTWKSENRFGGGNEAKKGLTRDGELFLEYMAGKGIAIDLSHTSDALADDILNLIDKKGLQLIPIASHSNFRKICDHPRNLPDSIAKEIAARGGVIGLNFVRYFVGKKPGFSAHIEHAKSLGIFDQLCFGADFFCEGQFIHLLASRFPVFYKEYSDASCYPRLLEQLPLTEKEKILLCHKNMEAFFTRLR